MSPRRFLSSSIRARDGFGVTIFLAMAGYAAAVFSLAMRPDTASWWMRRFHLRSESFELWALTQVAPWMYNFENRVLISDRPLSEAELKAPPGDLHWRYVNHQSARLFTFVDGRAQHLWDGSDKYYYLESRYRDERVSSGYHLALPPIHGDGASATEAVRIEVPGD